LITVTSTALLLGLRDPKNDQIWSEFYARYQPLLLIFCRRLGLSEQDAQDATQEALLAFAEAYRKGQYDPGKGRLRTWLSEITRNKVTDMYRRRGREVALAEPDSKTAILQNCPDDSNMQQIWDAEWHRHLVAMSIDAVRGEFEPSTMRAFELMVLEEWPVDRVAADLGLSPNAVYKAKRKVLSQMRSICAQMEAEF
jgi:RNA polymerase sigma-70 factor (ECF subfamily)